MLHPQKVVDIPKKLFQNSDKLTPEKTMSDLDKNISIGTVIEVFTDTYTASVHITSAGDESYGDVLECKIQVLKLTDLGAAAVSLPLPQDQVYVTKQFSKTTPSIIGYVTPARSATSTTEHQAKLTPLRQKTGSLPKGLTNIRGKAPADSLPGDDFKTGNDGQVLGMLTGGSLIAKATTLCQLLLTKSTATATLVARRLKIFTDFGEIVSESKNGSASVAIRGNSHVKKSAKAESFDTELQLGGSQALNLNLNNKFNLAVDKSGNSSLNAVSKTEFITQDINTEIKGSSKIDCKGSQNIKIGKDKGQRITGVYKRIVNSSEELMTLGPAQKIVNGRNSTINHTTCVEKTTGLPIKSTENVAKEISVERGDFEVNIGSLFTMPSLGTLPHVGSFKVNVAHGKIGMNTLFGDIEHSTVVGSVISSTVVGTNEVSAFIGKATLKSDLGITEMTGLLSQLNTKTVQLSGSSSSDQVVTAIKLTTQLFTKIISVYNMHTHIALLPGIPTSPPLAVMQPISPNDIWGSETTLA